jgi:hypothetical protein
MVETQTLAHERKEESNKAEFFPFQGPAPVQGMPTKNTESKSKGGGGKTKKMRRRRRRVKQ